MDHPETLISQHMKKLCDSKQGKQMKQMPANLFKTFAVRMAEAIFLVYLHKDLERSDTFTIKQCA